MFESTCHVTNLTPTVHALCSCNVTQFPPQFGIQSVWYNPFSLWANTNNTIFS